MAQLGLTTRSGMIRLGRFQEVAKALEFDYRWEMEPLRRHDGYFE